MSKFSAHFISQRVDSLFQNFKTLLYIGRRLAVGFVSASKPLDDGSYPVTHGLPQVARRFVARRALYGLFQSFAFADQMPWRVSGGHQDVHPICDDVCNERPYLCR